MAGRGTVVVSDLHLGAPGTLLARDEPRAQLLAAAAQSERVVLLGDTVDLRHGPAREMLAAARPFLDELAALDPEIVLVPGNHDHALARPMLGRRLGLENVADGGPLLPRDIRVAYPGLWLRDDVYATHGHYLDCHLHVPRPEVILAHATQLFAGRIPRSAAPAHYERALAPVYRAAQAWAERGRPVRETGWRRVAKQDWIGREALRAMGEVVRRLGIDAEHVIFGHTHRPVSAGRLVNAGGWVEPRSDAYTPGTIVFVGASGPPELRYVLGTRSAISTASTSSSPRR